MLKPTEYITVSKTGDERGNHDGLVINGNYLAVIDAYQARGWRAWDGKPAGIFAKNIIVSTLGNLVGDLDAAEVITRLEKELQKQSALCMETFRDDEIYAYPQARVLIYSAAKREIWRLGDSPFVIDGKLYEKKSETLEKARQKRVEVTEHFLANDRTDLKDLIDHDYGRSAAMELIVQEERRVDGVESLSGRADVDMDKLLSNVEVFPVEVDQEVILASDGFPRILPTLDESEDWLAAERARDPLFIHDYQALKGATDEDMGYDDRSYIRFTVE